DRGDEQTLRVIHHSAIAKTPMPFNVDQYYGNDQALYLIRTTSNLRTIHKATFYENAQNRYKSEIMTEFFRQLDSDEMLLEKLIVRENAGMKTVYRICDNPETDAVCVDISDDALEGLKLYDLHRGQLIYIELNEKTKPKIERLSKNVLKITTDFFLSGFASCDEYPLYFIYQGGEDEVFVCNIEIMGAFTRVETEIRPLSMTQWDEK
ncbi:hypothetical protein PENTCL1PPCAC_5025, partial [Pristionchus entomophagus]